VCECVPRSNNAAERTLLKTKGMPIAPLSVYVCLSVCVSVCVRARVHESANFRAKESVSTPFVCAHLNSC